MPEKVIQSVSSIRYKPENIQISFIPEETLNAVYCKFGDFREGLFSRNFAYAKFRENEILAKSQKSLCRLLI